MLSVTCLSHLTISRRQYNVIDIAYVYTSFGDELFLPCRHQIPLALVEEQAMVSLDQGQVEELVDPVLHDQIQVRASFRCHLSQQFSSVQVVAVALEE